MGRRFSSRRRNINPAEKNYVINSQDGIASGTSANLVLVKADDLGNDNSISFPGIVKAIYVMSSMAQANISTFAGIMAACLIKDIGGTQFSALNPQGPHSNQTQQQLIYWYRMNAGRISDSYIRHVGWIAIPKRHQIFNEGDALRWVMNDVNSEAQQWEHCTNVVYKHTH